MNKTAILVLGGPPQRLVPASTLKLRQGVAHVAKQALVLELLLVPVALGLPGLGLGQPGPLPLRSLLLGGSLPLQRLSSISLLLSVASYL